MDPKKTDEEVPTKPVEMIVTGEKVTNLKKFVLNDWKGGHYFGR